MEKETACEKYGCLNRENFPDVICLINEKSLTSAFLTCLLSISAIDWFTLIKKRKLCKVIHTCLHL